MKNCMRVCYFSCRTLCLQMPIMVLSTKKRKLNGRRNSRTFSNTTSLLSPHNRSSVGNRAPLVTEEFYEDVVAYTRPNSTPQQHHPPSRLSSQSQKLEIVGKRYRETLAKTNSKVFFKSCRSFP